MTRRQTLPMVFMVLALGACSAQPGRNPDTPAGIDSVVTVVEQGDVPELENASELESPEPALGYEAREGRTLFAHYCATCHGEQGRGDGFNAYNLDPRPRDLSDVAFQKSRTDAELSELIKLGGASAGLSTAMPPWGRTIDGRGVDYLVSYLRELRPEQD